MMMPERNKRGGRKNIKEEDGKDQETLSNRKCLLALAGHVPGGFSEEEAHHRVMIVGRATNKNCEENVCVLCVGNEY
jgi:hypothetical protein